MAVTSPKPKQSKAQVFGSPLKDKNKQTKKTPAGYHPKPDLCLPTSRANTTFVHHWVITPLEKATSQKLLAKRIHLNALFWGSKLSLLQIGEGSGWIKGNLQDRKGPGKKKKTTWSSNPEDLRKIWWSYIFKKANDNYTNFMFFRQDKKYIGKTRTREGKQVGGEGDRPH